MKTDSDAPGPGELEFRAGSPWRTLANLFWPERRPMAVSLALFVVKASPVWVLPLITANVIDLVAAPARHRPSELWWCALLGSLLILQNIPTHTAYYNALSLAVRRVETRLRSVLCRHLQQLSISYYKHASTGALQSKVLRDVESLGMATRSLFDGGLTCLSTIVVIIVVTSIRAPYFLPIFLLTTPLGAALRPTLRRRLQPVNQRFRQEFEGMTSRLLGMIDMIPVTRAHAVEEDELAQVESRLGEVEEAGLKLDAQNGFVGALVWVVFTQLNLLGLILGAALCYYKILPLTAGDVVLMSGYFSALTGSLTGLFNMLPIITRGFESVRSMGEVLDSPDIEENRGKRTLTAVRGRFEFQSVGFAYIGAEGAGGHTAIEDFTLTVEPGETLGVVGASGSGKSTLMSLLLGFHRPASGRLLLDGQDMSTFDLRSYRQYLAVVGQETILFQGTLRDNILYGAHGTDEARLQAALVDANALEFISRLPRGLETLLGENGARLSGGQRQRIAIARALIRDPRVLLLDEATSALDAGSEFVVQQALDRLMAGRTTFIVAHRLSTLRRVNRIVVLESGRLVEAGPPDELLRRPDGAFARLHAIQSLAVAG